MTDPPTTPDTLPKYLAEGIPKQDDQTLEDIRAFVDTLLKYRQQTVDPAEPPDSADPVDTESNTAGTIVAETVTCGDDSCHCIDPGCDEYEPSLSLLRPRQSLTPGYFSNPATILRLIPADRKRDS